MPATGGGGDNICNFISLTFILTFITLYIKYFYSHVYNKSIANHFEMENFLISSHVLLALVDSLLTASSCQLTGTAHF